MHSFDVVGWFKHLCLVLGGWTIISVAFALIVGPFLGFNDRDRN